MPVQADKRAATAGPDPFPEGWYFLTSRRALLRAGLVRKTWMGESIVVWCDDGGNVCVAEAYCPHLGADLGPAAGGRVRDGRLVCPFHRFEFDVAGQCVATPFAPAPRAARLRVFETREIAGLIFAWWGIDGREPQWHMPAEGPDQDRWSNVDVWTHRLPGHPQDTSENAVDLGHFRIVHGYDGVERLEPVSVDGHYLLSRFNFRTARKVGGITYLKLALTATTHVHGLGYSFVEVHESTVPLDMRVWILATPVDGTLIDLSVAMQVREIRAPRRRIVGLGFLPRSLRARVLLKFLAPLQHADVLQDVGIWSNKRYRHRPRLCQSDGEIMQFRSYCAQFYPQPYGG
jgi:nitrite reductase/ring-hydroxylating ferredoxin subunit